VEEAMAAAAVGSGGVPEFRNDGCLLCGGESNEHIW
jgi:hypothetical protein